MVDIRKSPADDRTYLYRRLQNGVQCVVISDPATDMSAAAMSVHSGSLRDPRDAPGLSHFLEHMLFLGTEKYPEESTYQTFIKENSGETNAYTGHLETNYYFSVAKDKLEKALDIFAQFFISPLFTESCVDREMHAVDSENAKNQKNDIWRLHQLLCSLATPGHEFNHFATGNLQTLQIPAIRDRLISHYKETYSADRMAFVLLGKEDVETLMSWCEGHFSRVPTYSVPEVSPPSSLPYSPSQLCTFTKVTSIMDKKELKLVFQLPGVMHLYQAKPLQYISHLIGHEGANSILSMLKEEGLALELYAGASWYLYKDYSLFLAVIELTEKGMAEYEKVLEIIFQYIAMLKEKGVKEWIYTEMKNLAEAEFRFKSKIAPENYTSKLASNLHKYSPEYLLTGNDLLEEYRPDLIADFIAQLTPANLMVQLISNHFAEECTSTEKWYETKYVSQPLSQGLLERLMHSKVEHPTLVLDLPLPNPYIPDSFDVLPSGPNPIPVLLVDNERFSLYHKQDDTFKKDAIHGLVYMITLDCGFSQTALGQLCGRLWRKLFFDHIRELNYMGEKAGIDLKVSLQTFGMCVRAVGFSQHYEAFMLEIFTKLAQFQVEEKHRVKFEEHYDMLKRELENDLKRQTYEQAIDCYGEIFCANGVFTNKELQTDMQRLTFEDLLYFSPRWLKCVRFDWLLFGNVASDRATSIATKCVDLMAEHRGTMPLAKKHLPWLLHREVPIQPVGAHFVYETDLSEPTDENSCIFAYWQIGLETLQNRAQLLVLESILSQPCFNQLRTEKQLGYVVWTLVWRRRDAIGFGVILQSHIAAPVTLGTHIDQFLDGMKPTFAELSDEAFATHQESVYKTITKSDVKPLEEFERYEREMTNFSYCFDRKAVLGNAILKTTKEEVQQAFTRLLVQENRRVDIHFVSANLKEQQTTADKGALQVFQSLYSLRARLSTLPCPNSHS